MSVGPPLEVEIKASDQGFEASINRATQSIKSFERQTNASLTSISTSLTRLKTAFITFETVRFAYGIARDIVDVGVQMQALENRMVAATGDAKVAADAMAYVRSECERLGLPLLETGNSFGNFSASALRAGLTLQQTKNIFTGVAEAATALHLSNANIGSVFLAIEQMASKGNVQMQELKLQLGQAVPGAVEIFAKAMGKSNAELNKMVQNGEISIDSLTKLGDEFHRQFGERRHPDRCCARDRRHDG